MVEGGGFEPPKAEPSDLQSDPFGHSGTPPEKSKTQPKLGFLNRCLGMSRYALTWASRGQESHYHRRCVSFLNKLDV